MALPILPFGTASPTNAMASAIMTGRAEALRCPRSNQ